MHYHVYCNTVYNSQDIEITYVSTGRKRIMLVRWKKMLLCDLNYMWCLQTNPNTYKKASSWIQRTDRRLPEVRAGELRSGRYCEDSQKVQTSSYKDIMYSTVTVANKTCIFERAKRVNLKTSHHKKNNFSMYKLDVKQRTGSKLENKHIKAVYFHPTCLTYRRSTLCEMPGWMNHKLKSGFLG